MIKTIKNLVSFSFGPIIGMFLSIATISISTYFIGPEEYGKSSMFALAQAMSALIIYMGIDQAFVRMYNHYDDKDKLLKNAMILPFFVASLLSVFVFIFQKDISIFLFGTAKETFVVKSLVILVFFMILEHFSLLKIRMEERGWQYSFFIILLKILTLIFTIIFIFYYEKSFRSIVFGVVISQIINSIIIFLSIIKSINLSFNIDTKIIMEMFKFGLPIIPASIIGYLLNSVDKMMLRNYSTFYEIGIYAAALKITSMLGIIKQCFTLYWVPVAYRWHKEEKNIDKFKEVADIVGFIMSILLLFILLFKYAIVIILGPNYTQSIYIMPFLLLFPIMSTMSETTSLGIAFSGRTSYNILVSATAAIVNIALNYILIPRYHALGAAIATGISYIVFFYIRTYFSMKLWKKFNMRKLDIYTIVILVNSLIHSLDIGIISYIVTLISIFALILFNISLIKSMIFKKTGI